MNILIVTPFYKQDKNIGSVRWTKLAPRLAKKNRVIVVTQPIDDMEERISVTEEDGIKVIRANQKCLYEKIAVKYFGGATGSDWQTRSTTVNQEVSCGFIKESWIRKLKNTLLYYSFQSKAKSYANWICNNALAPGEKIDVVLSSACPFIEMLFGYELKKHLKCKWVCEFRDLPNFNQTSCSGRMERKLTKFVIKKADAVITIAEKGKIELANGFVDDIGKIHIIMNGFSLSDCKAGLPHDDDILHIVHTGSLYGGRRHARVIIEAIKRIKEKYPTYKIKIECAGGNNSTIIGDAKKIGLESCIDDKGFITREEALKLQSESDCLLALVENLPGSIPAKLFEYILNKKPIICITCGKEPNSDSTKLVNDLNLGLAVEEYDGECSVAKLSDYLIMQYERKIAHQSLEYAPIMEKVRQYDHDEIVRHIEELFYNL